MQNINFRMLSKQRISVVKMHGNRFSIYDALPVLIAFFFASLSAIRTGRFWEKNDTLDYLAHYQCTASSFDIFSCNDLIGSSFDLSYLLLAKFISIASFSNQYVFLFVVSFIVIFPVVKFIIKNSPIPFLSLVFLLTDFRFYETFTNMLRHGLALAMALVFFDLYFQGKRRAAALFAITGFGFHFSTFFFYISPFLAKFNKYFILLVASIFILVAIKPDGILSSFFEFFSGQDKLLFYAHAFESLESQQASYPIHYLAIALLGVFLYFKDDLYADYVVILFVTLLGIWLYFLIINLPVAYRFLALLTPFISILLAKEYVWIVNKFQITEEFKFIGQVFVSLVLLINLISNFDAIFLNFS